MIKDDIITLAEKFIENSPNNYITEEIALHPRCAGMKIYEAPIFAFGSADDGLYNEYKSFDVIGSHFLSPAEWLRNAKTVISFFLPYTEKIKTANSLDCQWPADEWLHGRYEGQILLKQLLEYIVKFLSEAGFKSIAPSNDQRFRTGDENIKFTSNWSERHVAYACGLGTFGLSKGIITKKGMSGRLGSVLTELDLPKDSRDYNDIYEYCAMCGICIDRCPVHAISFEDGKNHPICGDFLGEVMEKQKPRYGCGKCQAGVPCESGIPMK
ncbi:MAG: 4Fe-4S binding protein [Defluviitaleaceae bacterium]|nr:4Fe-4S binding protein [Defluviitaleaceae bacterium]MCL2836288.1 4Fe-4S binding protein [Defluviitaleaceae bacterium]